MIDQIQHQIEELKEKLRELTFEKQRLAERAEDIYILSRINHSINQLSDPDQMITTALKMMSDLKGLPFCACGIAEKNKINNPIIQVSYALSSHIDTIYLNAALMKELEKGSYYTDQKSKDNNLLFESLQEKPFTPESILLIPFHTISSINRVFIFSDQHFTPNRLAGMKAVLEETVQILGHKLDNHYLHEALKKMNLNLEKIISDRTAELWHTNNILRNEIEEKKKVADRLKDMNEKLNNFVYRVSHDLRAPITSVEGLITVIKFERKAQSPKVDEYISILEERIQSLDRFIRDILSHSRISNAEIQLEKIQFKQIIKECFEELDYLEYHDKIERIVKIQGAEFVNDRVRIYEIFRNLISNAIKYSDPKKKKNKIQITIKTDRKSTIIDLLDTGIGMDKEVIPHIFDMFYRGHEQSKGTGIGLYIVSEAVRKLKGKIDVQSTPGQGTGFSIQLPNRIQEIEK